MANDLIGLIVRVNLALAAGVLVVLALRLLVRHAFGARIAYALWLLPALAAGACFLPARIERLIVAEPLTPVSSSLGTFPAAAAAHPTFTQAQPIVWLAIWCAGVALSLTILALRQGRFARALGRLRPRSDLGAQVFGAESSVHGPAVMGVLRPIIVTPSDFDQRYSDEERRIVLAHERAHLAQGDPLINAFVVALQCVNWFNPFIHLGARALRLDQELAADAAVLATSARRPYAEAILKTQIAASAPLGCAWPSTSLSALKERIAMLKNNLPTRSQRILGVSAVGLASVTACAVAWAAQPPRVLVIQEHATPADAALPATAPLPPDPLATLAAYTAPSSRDDDTGDADNATADADNATADADNATAEADSDTSDSDSQVSRADSMLVGGDQHARIRAAIAQARAAADQARAAARAGQSQAVREAIAQSRAAFAEARTAAREAQVEGMRAAREAQTESVRAAVAAAREVNSPEMQAEIRAMAAEAAQMARSADMTEQQRDAMRARIRARADHLRELGRRACDHPHTEHNDDSAHTERD